MDCLGSGKKFSLGEFFEENFPRGRIFRARLFQGGGEFSGVGYYQGIFTRGEFSGGKFSGGRVFLEHRPGPDMTLVDGMCF